MERKDFLKPELAGVILGARSSAAHDNISTSKNDLSESSRINSITSNDSEHFETQLESKKTLTI